jgi:serine/threonine protein kinase
MSFSDGETVGPYRIIEQLGQGGMATVYKAYHASLDRFVAIKVLHPAFLEDANFLARFQREARLVARLDHPNIVPIHDYAEHEGRPYLVMKFIEGETLKARLEKGPLSADETSHIVDKVGAALAYAHKRGILHRDIKPSNVLLTKDDEIYLADFGLARIAQSGESTLTSDMIVGTPQYISPEQALGKKDLDEGTDIYSFGVMLYEMTVGKVPFSADTPFSVIHDHIYTPLPLPRSANPSLSEDLERVLLKALAKDRPDRYPNVHAMVDAFQKAWKESAPGGDAGQANNSEAETQSLTSESAMPLDETLPPAVTPVPISAETVSASNSDTTGAQTKLVKPKGKFSWMWLAVVVVLVLGCLVTWWAFRSTRQYRLLPIQAGLAETIAPIQTPQNILDIGQALRTVEQNPDDPNAHLQLAFAYQQAQMVDKMQDEITKFEELASSNEDLLWNGSRQSAANDAWLAAARLALTAAELQIAAHGPLPDDL